EHHELGLPGADDVQRRWAVGGGEHGVALVLEIAADQFDQIGLVVDDQHGRHSGAPAPGRRANGASRRLAVRARTRLSCVGLMVVPAGSTLTRMGALPSPPPPRRLRDPIWWRWRRYACEHRRTKTQFAPMTVAPSA